MAIFLAVFLVSLAAVAGAACAINYFFRISARRSILLAAIGVSSFLLFCATGLWADAEPHTWGALTPLFALILLGVFLLIRSGKAIWAWWQRKLKELIGE